MCLGARFKGLGVVKVTVHCLPVVLVMRHTTHTHCSNIVYVMSYEVIELLDSSSDDDAVTRSLKRPRSADHHGAGGGGTTSSIMPSKSSYGMASSLSSLSSGGGVVISGGVIFDTREDATPPGTRATYASLCLNPRLRLLTSPSGQPGKLLTSKAPPSQALLSFAPPPLLPSLQVEADDLPAGVILLRGFLNVEESHSLIRAADEISLVRPFEIPVVRRPTLSSDPGGHAFSSLYQAYAGMVWEGSSSKYVHQPKAEVATGEVKETPPIPSIILTTARHAVEKALSLHPNAFENLPEGDSDAFTLICSFYARQWGYLSPHSDTSEPCLKAVPPRLWPVVSMSVGDEAEFILYPDYNNNNNGEVGRTITIKLCSGDVLLFGGVSRLIRHEVKSILPGGIRPKGLRMIPGRLNFTLRGL